MRQPHEEVMPHPPREEHLMPHRTYHPNGPS